MSYSNLNSFVKILEKNDEIIRVQEFVNTDLQMSEIVDRFSKSSKGGKAVLFENNGTEFPVLINAFGSNRRMCLALGINNLDDISKDIEKILKDFSSANTAIIDKLKVLPKISKIASYFPKRVNAKAECQEIVKLQPDLYELPILKCWPNDGGKFITLPSVHTVSPVNGTRNVGMYRMQIFDKNTTGMHWHKHKGGAQHYEEYKKMGKKMPVSVTLGGDPAYTYSATAPLPDNLDEYLLAGFIRKEKVKLVKSITNEIEVPKDVDIVIEGYIDPKEELILEGPFGDHTGYYSLADYYPKFHVTCISYRKDPIYPATVVGIPPMEDFWIAKATERIFFTPIKFSIVPEIIDMNFPQEGVAHNITIVKIRKKYAGQAQKVMNALWGAGQMMFNKILIVVDEKLEIDLNNYQELSEYILKNINIDTDIHFNKGPIDVLDHSSQKFTFGSKIGIDLTTKFIEERKQKNNSEKKIHLNTDIAVIKNRFEEIVQINCVYKKAELVIVSVKKKNKNQLMKLIEKLSEISLFKLAKVIIFVDWNVDVYDLSMCAWIVAGNIDPERDCIVSSVKNKLSQICVDATKKSSKNDDFERNWPNIIVSKDKTIKEIDNIIKKINKGIFIESPSIKYKKLLFGDNAIAKE